MQAVVGTTTALAVPLVLAIACGPRDAHETSSADAPPPWASSVGPPALRPGMIWVPSGQLVVGTPLERVPRVPDAEMPGVHMPFEGFFIDVFPHPNEPGAIPTSNVSRSEAAALCSSQDKRLCTELELERACKGPENTTYPYGEDYRREPCGSGADGRVVPNGYHAGCKSAFGVQDTHGSVWVWSSSSWGRGTEGLFAIRGGSSARGELVGRCAHGRGVKPETKRSDLGVRCCAGPSNAAEVALDVERGPSLRLRIGDDATARRLEERTGAVESLEEGTPKDAKGLASSDAKARSFAIERLWTWHPLGNEQLLLGGGCSAREPGRVCGLMIARDGPKGLVPLAFVRTDKWQPTVSEAETARELFVHGGDDNGAFRKRVSYDWGRLGIAEKQRKRKRKGKFRYE